MIDPTPNETAALEAAGALAGEYLDSLGQTDLARLTHAQWRTLIEVIVAGYGDRLRELCARDALVVDRFTPEVPPA